MSREAFRKSLAAELGIAPDEAEALVAADRHPYSCSCAECLRWWALMGPDPDSPDGDGYGPFTEAEVVAEKARMEEARGP